VSYNFTSTDHQFPANWLPLLQIRLDNVRQSHGRQPFRLPLGVIGEGEQLRRWSRRSCSGQVHGRESEPDLPEPEAAVA
jgi:hypothetical protein